MYPASTAQLKTLTNLYGVPGQEEAVSAYIKQQLAPHSAEFFHDVLGSLIIRSKGHGEKKLALVSHIDEVGFMVQGFYKDGSLQLFPLGRIDTASSEGADVFIKAETRLIRGKLRSFEGSLVVDAQFSSDKEAEDAGIKPGSWVCFSNNFIEDADFIYAKALDNRLSCSLAMDLFCRLGAMLPYRLFFIGSAQEEVGTRGAKTAISLVQPDLCLVLDVASPKDQEDPKRRLLGKGPCLCFADKTALGSRRLLNLMDQCAREEKIPIQYDFLGGGTDAGAVQQLNIETASIILPVQGCHTPISSASKNDYDYAFTLLSKVLQSEDLFA